jgi:hypothetical protein
MPALLGKHTEEWLDPIEWIDTGNHSWICAAGRPREPTRASKFIVFRVVRPSAGIYEGPPDRSAVFRGERQFISLPPSHCGNRM